MTQTWTARECAEAWGVKEPTWSGYVSRGQAPAPLPGDGPRRWDADVVRTFPRPGAGRSRAAANPEAEARLAEAADLAARIAELRARQRDLARAARDAGAETRSIARASGVSPQTVYGWLA
jgi:cell division septum initiation protein DivIVA